MHQTKAILPLMESLETKNWQPSSRNSLASSSKLQRKTRRVLSKVLRIKKFLNYFWTWTRLHPWNRLRVLRVSAKSPGPRLAASWKVVKLRGWSDTAGESSMEGGRQVGECQRV